MANYRRPWLLYVTAFVAYVFLFAPIVLVDPQFVQCKQRAHWMGRLHPSLV